MTLPPDTDIGDRSHAVDIIGLLVLDLVDEVRIDTRS